MFQRFLRDETSEIEIYSELINEKGQWGEVHMAPKGN